MVDYIFLSKANDNESYYYNFDTKLVYKIGSGDSNKEKGNNCALLGALTASFIYPFIELKFVSNNLVSVILETIIGIIISIILFKSLGSKVDSSFCEDAVFSSNISTLSDLYNKGKLFRRKYIFMMLLLIGLCILTSYLSGVVGCLCYIGSVFVFVTSALAFRPVNNIRIKKLLRR